MKLSFSGLLYLTFFASNLLLAQKENSIWYFGDRAGLDFNTSPPTPITSNLKTLEGTSSVSDPDGHLLFYTNGTTVWDRHHAIMPNGTGLLGAESSTQAALIVPLPLSCHQYYLFATEDHYTNGGLTYSIVDMCLNNGDGDIVTSKKNILLQDQTAEKITAILHANGRDIWILTHKLGSDQFLAYLLSATGINPVPVISSVGSTYPADGHIGPVRSSHTGKKVVSSASFRNICEMFDFDAATGMLSNRFDLRPLLPQQSFVYGIEFSPNDSLLYLSTFYVENNLFQINLKTNQVVNLNSISGNYIFGMLQMGNDRKIYMARNGSAFVDVIRQPDVPGTGCQYDEGGQDLLPGTLSLSGLPNFPPYSFFLPSSGIWSIGNDTMICEGDTLMIHLDSPANCPVSYTWNDGTTIADKSIFQAGTYWVDIQTTCQSFRDTLVVTQSPKLNITLPDTFFCEGKKISLTVTSPGARYKWSTGSTQSFITIDQPGTYWLEMSNSCNSDVDTFRVSRLSPPSSLISDTSFCAGDTVTVHLCHAQGSLMWSTGATSSSIQITKGGDYWLELSNICYSLTDDFKVTALHTPSISLVDTTICSGGMITLNVTEPLATYYWSDQSTGSSIRIHSPGQYAVTVTNSCGKDSAFVMVEIEDCDFSVFVPNVFTPNADGINDKIGPGFSKAVEKYLFQIFDRWGNCVFISHDSVEAWDGLFHNRECSAGVYAYWLEAVSANGIRKQFTGDITLVR